ncbi:MAG: glycine cleavage system aminomethyltransferase GcvT, partial [Planctomycetota bacterium]
ALYDVHVALGARMVEFGGWEMPVQYGPILDEVRKVRTQAGLFDLSHMGRVLVQGRDAVKLVDKVATNFCARIPVGAIRYALFCRADGNPIDDVLLYREQENVFIVVNAGNRDVDVQWLREHALGLECKVVDQSDELAMLALQGQASQAILQPLVQHCDLAQIKYYRFGFGEVCGLPRTRISRTGYTGEDGFEVYLPVAHARRVWDELLAAGAPHGLAPIGLGARDTLRLEAGMPLYGHEIDSMHNPIEAGLAFGISFAPEKGDWLGRAALERVKSAPRQRLVGITTSGPRAPRQGYELYAGAEKVGYVVSGSVSPTLGTNIGSAYVKLGHDTAGRALELDIKGKRQPCVVQELPFFSRTRK